MEEDWNKGGELRLKLEHSIPGSYSGSGGCSKKGGTIWIYTQEFPHNITFITDWPKEVDIDNLNVEVVYSLKSSEGEILVEIKSETLSQEFYLDQDPRFNQLHVMIQANLSPENIYDLNRSFTFQADILVELKDQEKIETKNLKDFVKDINSIFEDGKSSDVLVRCGVKEFKCHKNVLTARSDVFKKMLAGQTLENETNTVDLKEVTAEATEDMLKFIYTGTLAKDIKSENIDLLHAADMYQIEALKEACVKILVNSLNVSTCISTLIMVDRYIPHVDSVREEVIRFIKCKAEELVDMEDWDKLMVNFPALEKEVVKAIVKGSREKHVCKFCLVSYSA